MNRIRAAAVGLALPGLVGLFLPFAYGVSPLKVIMNPSDIFFKSLMWYAAPAFLAVAIAVWLVRRLFATRISPLEVALAYVLSAASMLLLLIVILLHWEEIVNDNLLPIGVALILSLGNVLLLLRNIKNHMVRADTAETFLLGGYLPNAVVCLIGFAGDLQSGGFTIAVACIAYLSLIVLLSRQNSKVASLPL